MVILKTWFNFTCRIISTFFKGYNSIVVNSGANFLVSIDDIKASESLIKESSILDTNTMITLEAALFSMKLAKEYDG